jgi:ABC-type glycerol-3-phosphate transport system substrate-binding protein
MLMARKLGGVLILGTAILVVAFLGYSYGAEKDTVLVWGYLDAAHFVPMVKQAERTFTPKTGIRVKALGFGYDAPFNKILLAVASKQVPDVVFMQPDWPMELYSRGAVVDLKREFGDDYDRVAAPLFQGSLKEFEFQGAHFALPTNLWTQNTFYRADIFRDNGFTVPETWDDIYALIPKLRAKGMDFIYREQQVASGSGHYWGILDGLMPFVFQRGIDFYSEDGSRSLLDTPEGIEAFKEFTELYTKYKIPMQANFQKVFRTGEAPLVVNGDIQIGGYRAVLKDVGKVDTLKMALFPGRKRGSSIDHTANLYAWTQIMMKDSPNKKAAWEYLKWYVSEEPQYDMMREWEKMLPGLPWKFSHVKATERFLAEVYSDVGGIILEQTRISRQMRPVLGAFTIRRFVINAFNEVTLKGEDPEVAIKRAAGEMNKEIKRKQKEFERFIYK